MESFSILLQRLLIGIVLCSKLIKSACVDQVALGLENSVIKDGQISSSGDAYGDHLATDVRLNVGKGWCALRGNEPFLSVDFNGIVTVSDIATEGADVKGVAHFTSKYQLQFSYQGKDWYDYVEGDRPREFTGYTDNKTLVRNTINGTMAKYMKIVPIFQVGQNVTCLKLEVYGCKSALKPKVEINPKKLMLEKGKDKVQCNATGQVGMTVRWIMPSADVLVVNTKPSKLTNGILYKESRSLRIRNLLTNDVASDPKCKTYMSAAVVVCERKIVCKAQYTFNKDISAEQETAVYYRKELYIQMTLDGGVNSPTYINANKNGEISCAVLSLGIVSVHWRNSNSPEWTRHTTLAVNKRQGPLGFVREVMLSIKPNADDIISKVPCKRTGSRETALCPTKFYCTARYHRHTSISVTKQKDVYFYVELPGKPDSLEAECQSTKCVITWSQSRSGDLTMKSFEYSVQVHGPSILSQRIVKAQRFEVTKLLPNRKYTVDIITRVKDSNGSTWSSDAAQVTFTTRTVAPSTQVTFEEPIRGSDSLTIGWQPLVLPVGNGLLLKYDFKLEQLKYGERDLDKVHGLRKILLLGNLNSTATLHVFDRLKPWSKYAFTLIPYNNHHQPGKESSVEVSTNESVPSKPPSDVHISVQARAIDLQWSQPPFTDRNGRIVQYRIDWKKMSSKLRKERNVDKYLTRTGELSEFKCGPRDNICSTSFSGLRPYTKYAFKIAAKTSKGLGPFSAQENVLTAQAAPTAPLSPASNESKEAFYLMWREPKFPNGVIMEYEIEMGVDAKIKADFTRNTYYDTNLTSQETIKFRVRGYTEYLHNNGGHPGDWTAWVIAKRYIKPYVPPKPHEGKQSKSVLAIGVSFGLVVFLLLMGAIVLLFLYRKRQHGENRRKSEVEMDSIADAENEDVHIVTGEKTPLTRGDLGSRETVDLPTEDHAHPPIPIEEFQAYVSSIRDQEDALICHQYMKELMTGKCYSTEVGLKPENKPKNRYVNIAAYDHSRVILRPESGKKIIHHKESDYFNANHIEGYCPQSSSKYIAAQGPMESVFPDFWRMVWQENISVIIMLTNLEEGEKVKCDQYWPSHGACKYGHITVRFLRADQTADYFTRTFEIEKGIGKDKIKRTLMQFHFISWPDYGVPEFPTAILSLRRRVRHNYCGGGPMLVHCSAGVGRTGCFILIDAMLERVDNAEGSVDIFNYLQYMRTRRINMVQTLDQYIFAHLSILEYLTFGDTEISVIDFEKKLKDLQRDSGIGNEFDLIESTSPEIESIDNSCKVLLKSGKFIDVFYVDGYKQRDAFLLSNSPSENLTPDFWKMLIEHNCHTIVMLNRLEDEENFKYWPDMSTHYNYDSYSVVMTSEHTNGNIATRKFKITSTSSPEEHFELQHFQFLDWPSNDVPKSRNSILTLMSLIEKSRQNYGNGPVLVHSGNGAGRSGTLISIYNSTERLKVEQLIDIPQCVRAIRTVVPNAIGVVRQYEFIYEMIRTYLEAFETYSNFSDPKMLSEEAS